MKTVVIFLGLVVCKAVSDVQFITAKTNILSIFRSALGDIHLNPPRQAFFQIVTVLEKRRKEPLL